MAVKILAELVKKEELVEGIYKFSVKAPEIVKEAKPGQFLEIKVSKTVEPFLRRPISIYNINKEEELIEFIFQIKGNGTKLLSELNIGDKIDIMGPLGKGSFEVKEYKKIKFI